MFKYIHLTLLCYCIIILCPLSAQQAPITLQDVGKLQDYSNPQCFALYQDPTGLLWMSNWSGIDRWDGNRMVNYSYNPFDSLGWPSRYVGRWITRDDQNNLWCMDYGLVKFDLEKERFQKIHLRYDSSELTIRYLKYDPEGYLWLVCKEGIFQYKHKEDFLKKISLSGSNGQEKENYRPRMVNILGDSTGRVWMSDNHLGLFYFEAKEDVFIKQSLNLPAFVDENMNMVRMKKDPLGNFWLFGNKAELARFNPYTREFEWAGLPVYDSGAPSTEGGMAIDDQGKIWFGVDRGLMLYNPFINTLTCMDTSYASVRIYDMISDQHGNILIGTYEGVKIIDSHDVAIRTIHLTKELSSEGTNWITSVARDGQTLWMGTFKTGIIRYNLETDQFVRFHADNRSGGFDHPYVCKTLRDRTGRIWFTAGWTGSLYRVAPDDSSFEHFHPGSSHIITQCDEGFFWIIDPERIVKFDPVTLDTIQIHFKQPLPIEYVRSHFEFIAFIRDKQGIFWFGQQDGGLYRIDPESRDWKHYNYNKDNPEGLPDQHVRSIFCDSRGTIWVSTWNGLSKIILQAEKDTVLSFDNHLIHNPELDHTLKITEDIQGNIYVGTLSGLMVIRPDGTIDKYTHKDRLPRDPSAIWMLEKDHENGAIYLGRSDIAIIPSGFLASEKSTAPTLFTGFMIGGEKVNPGEDSPLRSSILTADHINLRHDQNFFRIDFATPYFSHPERNRYRYILKGIDPDTVYSGNQSFAEYTNLAPGKYTFWVTGAIHREPWNPDGRSIEIIIHPPWYRSQAAMSGYLVSLLFLLIGYVRIRTEKLRKEKIILENLVAERTVEIRHSNEKIVEMERMKTRFFTDISHEIRTPLSLISGPLDNLLKEHQQSEKSSVWLAMIQRNGQRLLQLVNQLLDISRLDSGHVKLVLEKSDVIKHIRVLANEYHSYAEKNHICYLIDIPEGEQKYWNDRDKVNKIVTNLLSNAFKFTPEFGTVTCRVKILSESEATDEQHLRIIVADTGRGIHPEEHNKIFDRFYRGEGEHSDMAGGTGIGLSLTRDMTTLLHGEIRVKSMVGTGTIFMLTIPLGKAHLEEKEYILREPEEQALLNTEFDHEAKETSAEENFAREEKLILIVEDNDELRNYIMENLESSYRTMEAADGLKGWNTATSAIPDLIISDVMMPGMDGNTLCTKLKNDERTSHIPVIILTARASTYDKIEGLECGADDYIFKPFSMKEIEARISNLLEQRERLSKKYAGYIGLDWKEITVTTPDELFLKKATSTIGEHLHDFKFDVGVLQDMMAMSGSTLYKKLKALTGESPNSLMRIMRLKRAASLLEKNETSITGILMSVGFSNPSYFTRCFKAYFGVTPREYQRSFK